MNLNNKLNLKNNEGEEEARLFSEEALSEEGIVLNDETKVSLLCDDDIIYLYKNKYMDALSAELFQRNKRRHPLWKSEAEYRGYIRVLSPNGTWVKKFDKFVTSITKGDFKDIPSFSVIDKEYIGKIKVELANAQKALGKATTGVEKQSLEYNLEGIKNRLVFCTKLEEYAYKNGIDVDFIVLKADIFSSNFSKDYLKQTLIVFNDGDKENVFELQEVCPTLQASEETGNMFYVFYRKKEDTMLSGIKDFCEDLFLRIATGR